MHLHSYKVTAPAVSISGVTTSAVAVLDLSSIPGWPWGPDVPVYVEGVIVAQDGSGNTVSTKVSRTFERVSGTLAAVGASTSVLLGPVGDAALTGIAGLLVASGNSVVLQATGVALVTATFKGFIEAWSGEF